MATQKTVSLDKRPAQFNRDRATARKLRNESVASLEAYGRLVRS